MNRSVLGAMAAVVAGVLSGWVVVRDPHGEISASPGETATAPVSGPPRILSASEKRLATLEAEHAAAVQRTKAAFEDLQELIRRDRGATAPPDSARTQDPLVAKMSVELRTHLRQATRHLREVLGLSEEQRRRIEDVSAAFMNDFTRSSLAEELSLDDLERLAATADDLHRRIAELLTDDQKKTLAQNSFYLSSSGVPWVGDPRFSGVLKDLDPTTSLRTLRELCRLDTATGILFERSRFLETEGASEVLERLAPRTVDRLKRFLNAGQVAALENEIRAHIRVVRESELTR